MKYEFLINLNLFLAFIRFLSTKNHTNEVFLNSDEIRVVSLT